MTRARNPRKPAAPVQTPAPARVTLRALYAEAMRQVMADPRQAIAELDPPLATLLPFTPDTPPS